MTGAPPETQRVLPDGCCELVIHFGDRFTQYENGSSFSQPRELFVGPTARSLLIAPGANADVIAIRFQPGGAALLLGTPLAQLRDSVVDSRGAGARFGFDVVDALAPLDNVARVAALENALLTRLGRWEPAEAMLRAQRLIVSSHGSARIEEVAREAGLSTRQLQRRFREEVGLSPKVLARIARMQRALAIANAGGSTLARVAARAGYADQAHFTREFAELAGVPPTDFLRGQNLLNDLFSSDLG